MQDDDELQPTPEYVQAVLALLRRYGCAMDAFGHASQGSPGGMTATMRIAQEAARDVLHMALTREPTLAELDQVPPLYQEPEPGSDPQTAPCDETEAGAQHEQAVFALLRTYAGAMELMGSSLHERSVRGAEATTSRAYEAVRSLLGAAFGREPTDAELDEVPPLWEAPVTQIRTEEVLDEEDPSEDDKAH